MLDVYTLKQEIRDRDKVEEILESLGMHHIVRKHGYWSCGMPDGDNISSTTIYDSEQLFVIAYTRTISKNESQPSDIFTLIMFIKKINFPQAINYVCDILGIGFYDDLEEDIPASLLILKEIEDMAKDDNDTEEDRYKNKVRDISILDYYSHNVNELFKKDNISYRTQIAFNIGFDHDSNRITIPIFNELGQLVGVKGRCLDANIQGEKYIYLERCNKSQVLYGYNVNYDSIMQAQTAFVGEAEKFVMQLHTAGIRNAVALGGHKVSLYQRTLLERLCVPVCLCFDKDISEEEVKLECSKFNDWVQVYYMYDGGNNILNDKESPSDNIDKFKILREKHIYKYKRDEK